MTCQAFSIRASDRVPPPPAPLDRKHSQDRVGEAERRHVGVDEGQVARLAHEDQLGVLRLRRRRLVGDGLDRELFAGA
jgi:hypothetical protein